MIIDVHTHLWPQEMTPKYLERYFTQRGAEKADLTLRAEGLLQSMEDSRVEVSIVSALCFGPAYAPEDVEKMNTYVKAQIDEEPRRLIGFCTVNPFAREAVSTLRRLIEEDGFKGLKLHGNMQEFYPDNPELYPVYETMADYGLPILFHSGGIGLPPVKDDFGRPGRFDAVACDFPELPMILGHGGRIWYSETAMLLRKHQNVYADISTNIGRLEREAARPLLELSAKVKVWAGETRALLFGSDYPFYGQQETIEAAGSIKLIQDEDIVEEKDIQDMISRNAWAFCEKTKIL